MKLTHTLLLFVPALIANVALADFAPLSVGGTSAVVVISSGSGAFAPIGGYRITFTDATHYQLTPLTSTVNPSSGTYTYAKTAADTAAISVTDQVVGAAIGQTLLFSSPTTATFSVSGAAGTQSGTIVFENVTVTPPGSATGFINQSLLGYIAGGSAATSKLTPAFWLSATTRVLIRAVGPGLTPFGISDYLANPKLEVTKLGGASIAANDDWSSTSANQLAVTDAINKTSAFPLTAGSTDAAIVLDLQPGGYTCNVTGDAGTSGQVIVEVYQVPQ